MNNTSTSIVKVLSAIVDKKLVADKTVTTSRILLYKAGSTLTPTNLGTLSN